MANVNWKINTKKQPKVHFWGRMQKESGWAIEKFDLRTSGPGWLHNKLMDVLMKLLCMQFLQLLRAGHGIAKQRPNNAKAIMECQGFIIQIWVNGKISEIKLASFQAHFSAKKSWGGPSSNPMPKKRRSAQCQSNGGTGAGGTEGGDAPCGRLR